MKLCRPLLAIQGLMSIAHWQGDVENEFPQAPVGTHVIFYSASLCGSMQIISLDLALANGTMLTITPQSQPHLWKAAQVALSPTPQTLTHPLLPSGGLPRCY